MKKALGFSVRIFMPSGEPEGIRVIEKSNWTGRGLVFPRSILGDARQRPELSGTGVYILWGPGKSERLPYAYIGETTDLSDRLSSHASSSRSTEEDDLWTHGVAFTSKDQNLDKAHVQYLEAKLIELAQLVNRCDLVNKQKPDMPHLSEPDAADSELYLADMLLCLPVVGVPFFERPSIVEDSEVTELHLEGKGASARGFEDAADFVVRAQSTVVADEDEAPSIPAHVRGLRSALQDQGILVASGSVLTLRQDYPFSSPSTAASFVLGNSSNGRDLWLDKDKRPLREIQAEALKTSEPM